MFDPLGVGVGVGKGLELTRLKSGERECESELEKEVEMESWSALVRASASESQESAKLGRNAHDSMLAKFSDDDDAICCKFSETIDLSVFCYVQLENCKRNKGRKKIKRKEPSSSCDCSRYGIIF